MLLDYTNLSSYLITPDHVYGSKYTPLTLADTRSTLFLLSVLLHYEHSRTLHKLTHGLSPFDQSEQDYTLHVLGLCKLCCLQKYKYVQVSCHDILQESEDTHTKEICKGEL